MARVCQRCNHPNLSEAKFCLQCGAMLEVEVENAGDPLVGHLVGVGIVLAEHLDVPAERYCRERVLGFAAPHAPQDRAETDAEALDFHAAPLRHSEVPQLVDENHEAEPDGHVQNVQDLLNRPPRS